MGDHFFLNRAVHIVCPEGEGDLGEFWPDHYPVGLNMGEIIEIEAGDGDISQVVDAGGPGK